MENPLVQAFHQPTSEELSSSLYINWVGHRYCGSEHVIGPRVLDTFKIVFVLNGKGYLSQGAVTEHALGYGDMFVLFPHMPHYYHAYADDPWELMWVSISGSLCNVLFNQMGINRDNFFLGKIADNFIKGKISEIIKSLNDNDPIHLYSMGNLYLLLSKIKEYTQQSGRISEAETRSHITRLAIAFIEQNFNNFEIDVDLICENINFSRSYLSRTFRNDTGLTIPEYTNNIRIQKAKLLLRQTDLAVQDIAASVGICDSSYFSKLFKKSVGVSPVDYKNEINKKVE
jgi:AraC family transcriptional regulator, arabinose operon regulatory protein